VVPSWSSDQETFLGQDRKQERAVQLAYLAISTRERTVSEVRAFLERKELDESLIEYALADLVDSGALDDARFARLFTEDRRSIDQWGVERIDLALRRRGVPGPLIEEALADVDRDDELSAAVELLGQKVDPPESAKDRDRAWRILVRKGYEPELAYEAVRAHAG